jgi:hypothetical protein
MASPILRPVNPAGTVTNTSGPSAGARAGRRDLVDRASGEHMANEHRILAGLTAADRRQLAGLLRKLNLTLPPAWD